MNAQEILRKASGHMTDRASTYDKPEGERSMAQTVAIFNLYHGTSLTEAQGWHLLQILKDVRLFARDGYHADSAEDCVAYAALKAEALSNSDIDRGYAELMDKGSVICQSLKGAAEKFIAAQDVVSMIAEGIADADAGRVTPLEEVKARRIDSGPMWIEWRGESSEPPAAKAVVVEVRMRDGRTVVRPAGSFVWRHYGSSFDIFAWRLPWPDEARIDVIGQNGPTAEHYEQSTPVCLACGGSHPLARCGRDRATAEDESQ